MNWYKRMFKSQGLREDHLKILQNPSATPTMKIPSIEALSKLAPTMDVVNSLMAEFVLARQKSLTVLGNKCIEAIGILGPKLKQDDAEQVIRRLFTAASVDRYRELYGIIAKFGGIAEFLLPELYRQKDEAEGYVQRDIETTIQAIRQSPMSGDKPLVTPDKKQTIENWKRYKAEAVPGAKVKLQPIGRTDNFIGMGRISSVTYVDYAIEGQTIKVPVLNIELSNGMGKIQVNIVSPRFSVWIYRDPEDMPLNEYKGMWVKVEDPQVMDFVGTAQPAHAILLKTDEQAATVKVVKDGIPWTFDVPIGSVRPSMESPQWGNEMARRKHGYGPGDAVKFIDDPNNQYVVERVEDNGNIAIRPVTTSPGAGHVTVSPLKIKYVGRHDYYKGVVLDPHFRSPALIQKTPQDPEG